MAKIQKTIFILGVKMSNKNDIKNKQSEMSLWDLLGLLSKNIITIIIIIVATTLIGIFYSFIIQEQNIATHQIKNIVIYDEWDYYLPTMEYTYADDIKAYINDELGGDYIVTSVLSDTSTKDMKEDYNITIIFSPDVALSQVESIASKLPDWHNKLVEDGAQQILVDYENLQNELYANYVNAENTYCDYLKAHPDSMNLDEQILKSQRDLELELLKETSQIVTQVKYDLYSTEHYYIDEFVITSTYKNTWKNNIILSIAAGLALAIVFVLTKESYLHYKKDKVQ